MNDLQKELQDLKAKVAELEARISFPAEPVKQWQLKWELDCVTNESIQPYFTTLESAEKACDMLNSGEVEL